MKTRFCLHLAVAICLLAGRGNLFAADRVVVNEVPGNIDQYGSVYTEYFVFNDTAGIHGPPFAITAFAVSTTSGAAAPGPDTLVSGWAAQFVESTHWGLPIGGPHGGDFSLPTWEEYTGLSFAAAFPLGTAVVNGYFDYFSFDPDAGLTSPPGNPILPGQTRGGFNFYDIPHSSFIVAGPSDWTQPFQLEGVQTFSGTTTVVPEPGSLGLCLLALAGAVVFVRRTRRS